QLVATEGKGRTDATADVAAHDHGEFLHVEPDAGSAPDGTDRAVLRELRYPAPLSTGPEHVLVLATGLFPSDLGLDARNLGLGVAVRHDAGLEQTDADLCGVLGGRAVGQLGIEVGIDVAVADPPERSAAALHVTHGANSEQGLVVQDVLTLEQPQLAARQNLTPFATDGQVDLTHVDPIRILKAVVRVAGVLDLRRESDVSGEVHPGLLAARFKCREGGQEAGANVAVRPGPAGRRRAVLVRERPEGVYVPGKLERPSVGHLHRQALRAGRRGDAQRQAQQQQRATLHTRIPPWEIY